MFTPLLISAAHAFLTNLQGCLPYMHTLLTCSLVLSLGGPGQTSHLCVP